MWRGLPDIAVIPEGVDDVEAEGGGALHGKARHFCGGGVAVAEPEIVKNRVVLYSLNVYASCETCTKALSLSREIYNMQL